VETTAIDFVFVGIYFAIALGIGIAARRSVSSSLDFLLSGRSLPAWVTGLAFIAANLGAIELIGFTANGAQYGIPTVHYYWIGAIPAMVFLGIVMMPFYYGSKARSVPEFLRMRFNATTQRVNAVSFALASVLIAGVNLFSLGLVLEALLGWSLQLAIPIAALVVLSYTFLGGLSAAIYNEVLQFFVILALLIPLTVAGLARVGGWNGLQQRITEVGGTEELSSWPGTTLTEIPNAFLSVIGIVFGLGFVLSFGYWTTNFAEVQRCLSAKSMSAARRTPIIAAFPKALIPAVIVIPGIIAAVLVPQITAIKAGQAAEGGVTYNNTLSLLMGEVLPNGVLGVALAGLLAAFMAGMAANVSSLNTCSPTTSGRTGSGPARGPVLPAGRAGGDGGGLPAGDRHGVHRRQLREHHGLHPGPVQLLQRPAVRDLHPGAVLEADDGHGRLDRPGVRHGRGGRDRPDGPLRGAGAVLAGGQLRRGQRGVRRRDRRGRRRLAGDAAQAGRRAGGPGVVAHRQGGPHAHHHR
jgi:SSS family transporter